MRTLRVKIVRWFHIVRFHDPVFMHAWKWMWLYTACWWSPYNNQQQAEQMGEFAFTAPPRASAYDPCILVSSLIKCWQGSFQADRSEIYVDPPGNESWKRKML